MKFSEKGEGGEGGSKAVRKFSGNSFVLVETGFPYNHAHNTSWSSDGTCINMLERLLTWVFATLEDAVDLSPTTSGKPASAWKFWKNTISLLLHLPCNFAQIFVLTTSVKGRGRGACKGEGQNAGRKWEAYAMGSGWFDKLCPWVTQFMPILPWG